MLYIRRKFEQAKKKSGKKSMEIWAEVNKKTPMSWATFNNVLNNRGVKGKRYKIGIANWITEQTGEK